MLAPFLLCFVRFQLMDFFHHLLLRVLQRLQHFNEGVGIVSGESWLWLWFSPHSVNTFRLVRLLLVRYCWPRFCLRGHNAYVSRCPGSWWHLFVRASIPICFPTSYWSCQFKYSGPFCNVRLGCLLLYWAQVFWVKKLRLVQLQLTLIRLVHKLCLICQELRSHAHGRRSCFGWVMASRHDNNNKRKCFCL